MPAKFGRNRQKTLQRARSGLSSVTFEGYCSLRIVSVAFVDMPHLPCWIPWLKKLIWSSKKKHSAVSMISQLLTVVPVQSIGGPSVLLQTSRRWQNRLGIPAQTAPWLFTEWCPRALECARGVPQTKLHSYKSLQIMVKCKFHLVLVPVVDFNLQISRIGVWRWKHACFA